MHTVVIVVHISVAVIDWCFHVLSICMHAYTSWKLEKCRSTLCLHSWTVSGPLQICANYVLIFSLFVANLLISHLCPPCCYILIPSPVSISSFSKSVSTQQVQAASPQPSPGPPLVPANSQPAPSGMSQQVRPQKPLKYPFKWSFHFFDTTSLWCYLKIKYKNNSLFLCLFCNNSFVSLLFEVVAFALN